MIFKNLSFMRPPPVQPDIRLKPREAIPRATVLSFRFLAPMGVQRSQAGGRFSGQNTTRPKGILVPCSSVISLKPQIDSTVLPSRRSSR